MGTGGFTWKVRNSKGQSRIEGAEADYASASVETVASVAVSESAWSIARQASMAHLTRCGNLRTPWRSWRSPRPFDSVVTLPVTRSPKVRLNSAASARVLPFSFNVIIDAE